MKYKAVNSTTVLLVSFICPVAVWNGSVCKHKLNKCSISQPDYCERAKRLKKNYVGLFFLTRQGSGKVQERASNEQHFLEHSAKNTSPLLKSELFRSIITSQTAWEQKNAKTTGSCKCWSREFNEITWNKSGRWEDEYFYLKSNIWRMQRWHSKPVQAGVKINKYK